MNHFCDFYSKSGGVFTGVDEGDHGDEADFGGNNKLEVNKAETHPPMSDGKQNELTLQCENPCACCI